MSNTTVQTTEKQTEPDLQAGQAPVFSISATGQDTAIWAKRVEAYGHLETPFLLTDREAIRIQCEQFRSLLPQVQLCYALKAFPEKEVISTVDPLIDGYDVASIFEVKSLVAQGVDPRRLNFNNPVKSEEAIRGAVASGVDKFVFQSRSELEKIVKHSKGASVLVRVRMADSKGAQSFSSKFGCDPQEAVELLDYAHSLGLKPLGVTFHVGSQATEREAWYNAIRSAQAIVEEARSKGLNTSLINMGGGFPAEYRQDEPGIIEISGAIDEAIKDGPAGIDYVAEPGRFLVANSSVIVASVIGREERSGTPWLFLDVGTFQSFIEVFEFGKFHHPVYSLERMGQSLAEVPTAEFILTGPSCDSYDTMAAGIVLPADVKEGDKIVIGMAGAYTVVYGSNFNGFKVPYVQIIGDDTGSEKPGERI